jgi:hypothetical protein
LYIKCSSTLAAYRIAAAATVKIECIAVYEHVLLLAIYIYTAKHTIAEFAMTVVEGSAHLASLQQYNSMPALCYLPVRLMRNAVTSTNALLGA